MLFALICKDKPGHLQVRLDARPDHVAFLNGLNADKKLAFAGPFLDADGKPNGSMVVIEATDLAGAEALAAADPYAKAGLFEKSRSNPGPGCSTNPPKPDTAAEDHHELLALQIRTVQVLLRHAEGKGQGRHPVDGVRNYAARNNMKAMQIGDLGFFYHSNDGLNIVGIAEVCALAHHDTTTDDPRWECVDIRAVRDVPTPPTLADIKANPKLSEMALVRLGRLSVQPVTPEEWKEVCRMGGLNPAP